MGTTDKNTAPRDNRANISGRHNFKTPLAINDFEFVFTLGNLIQNGWGYPRFSPTAVEVMSWMSYYIPQKTQRLVWLIHATTSGKVSFIPVKLPWIFPGAQLTFYEAPGKIQCNLTGMKSVEEAHGLRPFFYLASNCGIVALLYRRSLTGGAKIGIFCDN